MENPYNGPLAAMARQNIEMTRRRYSKEVRTEGGGGIGKFPNFADEQY